MKWRAERTIIALSSLGRRVAWDRVAWDRVTWDRVARNGVDELVDCWNQLTATDYDFMGPVRRADSNRNAGVRAAVRPGTRRGQPHKATCRRWEAFKAQSYPRRLALIDVLRVAAQPITVEPACSVVPAWSESGLPLPDPLNQFQAERTSPVRELYRQKDWSE